MEIPLTKLEKGKTAVVKALAGGHHFQQKILSLGLRIGKKISIISTHPFRGPVVVDVDRMCVAVGRGMAEKVIVEVK